MYYDINLKSNWSEPSKVDSLPSLSPKLPTWLKRSYSPGWWWLGCPPTQWWLGTGLQSYLVRQWRLATKHKTDSLWLRRGRTQPGPVLLQEKSIQTNIPLSAFCPKVKIAFKAIPNYPDTRSPLANPKISLVPLSPPFVNVGFRASICSSVYLKKDHFKILLYISTFMEQKR